MPAAWRARVRARAVTKLKHAKSRGWVVAFLLLFAGRMR